MKLPIEIVIPKIQLKMQLILIVIQHHKNLIKIQITTNHHNLIHKVNVKFLLYIIITFQSEIKKSNKFVE
jgi:hypothetical protein